MPVIRAHLRPEPFAPRRPSYNVSMDSASRVELASLLHDLRRIFSGRLVSIVAYGAPALRPAPSLAVVESLTLDDLAACAAQAGGWHRAGAATPLLLTRDEFSRSADAFPIEYAEMHATATVLDGEDPFAIFGGVALDDLRRACEVQVRSHLLHLREDYLECGGRPRDVAALVADSAAGFAILLRHLARLDGLTPSTTGELAVFVAQRTHLDAHLIDDLLALADPAKKSAVDAARIFPAYLAAVANLARVVDEWHGGSRVDHSESISAP